MSNRRVLNSSTVVQTPSSLSSSQTSTSTVNVQPSAGGSVPATTVSSRFVRPSSYAPASTAASQINSNPVMRRPVTRPAPLSVYANVPVSSTEPVVASAGQPRMPPSGRPVLLFLMRIMRHDKLVNAVHCYLDDMHLFMMRPV